MNYNLLREKVELVIKGLECMGDPESEDEFCKIIEDFCIKQIARINKMLKAQEKAQRN